LLFQHIVFRLPRLGTQSLRHQFLSQGYHGDHRATYRNERSDRPNLISEHGVLRVAHFAQTPDLHLIKLAAQCLAPDFGLRTPCREHVA
jgi:hypothetical protein